MNRLELEARLQALREQRVSAPNNLDLQAKIYDCEKRILLLRKQQVMNSRDQRRNAVLLDIENKLALLEQKIGELNAKQAEKASE